MVSVIGTLVNVLTAERVDFIRGGFGTHEAILSSRRSDGRRDIFPKISVVVTPVQTPLRYGKYSPGGVRVELQSGPKGNAKRPYRSPLGAGLAYRYKNEEPENENPLISSSHGRTL